VASRAPPLTFHPATPDRWPDLEALFGERGACDGCWCQFWKQSPAEYRAGRGEANRRALRRSVRRGELPGLLAYAGDEAIGWVAVEPRASYRRLAVSRNLPVVDERPTWSIPCFFVTRGWRGKGVSARLLAEAVAWARRHGAPAVEGYPVDSQATLASAWLYTGTFSTFVEAGFTEVARRARTRPVVKKELGRRRARAR
jgi:GNAT superfamily N-acetyltransferase